MSKTVAIKEMYLIYRAFREYLAEPQSSGEYRPQDLRAACQSFCQREPIGGMFLESVLEELFERTRAS